MRIGIFMWNEILCNNLDCFISTFTYKTSIFFDFGDRLCFWKYFKNDKRSRWIQRMFSLVHLCANVATRLQIKASFYERKLWSSQTISLEKVIIDQNRLKTCDRVVCWCPLHPPFLSWTCLFWKLSPHTQGCTCLFWKLSRAPHTQGCIYPNPKKDEVKMK